MRLRIHREVLATLLLLCGCRAVIHAQVTVGISSEESVAVLYEPVVIKLSVQNSSGQLMSFGAGNSSARVSLDVILGSDKMCRPSSSRLLEEDIQIMSGESRTFEIELTRHYELHGSGLYSIQAIVEWAGRAYASNKISIEVIRGFEIQRIKAGIPGDEGGVRTYFLQYVQKKEGEFLYLQIEDDVNKQIYGIFKLGRFVRFKAPGMRLDEAGNVHVLYQSLNRNFIHAVFTPYGVPVSSKSHMGTGGKIALQQTAGGQVEVVGEDRPPPDAAPAPETTAPSSSSQEPQKKGRGLINRWLNRSGSDEK